MQAGVTIAFGSDYPFGALCPIAGIHTAVNHFHPAASIKCDEEGGKGENEYSCRGYEVFRPDQRICVEDAILFYTMYESDFSVFIYIIYLFQGDLHM